MGLEDLIDGKTDSGSQSSPNRGSRSSGELSKEDLEEQYHKVIGSPPNQKVFDEDTWNDVKRVLREVMGKNVNKVLNSPPQKRHEILHEAALYSEGKLEETEHEAEEKCPICDKAAGDAAVPIGGEKVHVHHTAGQIESAIKEGDFKLG